ncbi:type II toxin-antitoxin system RelE/ParE family toxin [Jiella endophytica]|uniref:Type II toxin-antitoxin system RelE/ParE family toxin n=1 Tax=Jiella endophytica TaxID=2558362 RepID=A0A4Y8RMB5_9HYPH|nr:type II toxin-antitoxin system RelE/ParE family toxin [Jiella endophytica]TFF24793.1 type II toxin-antitoxin system RelE/ParE family toxin [Jiella endophytica]
MGETRPLTLRYTPRALVELDEILEYIGEQSPNGADKVRNRLRGIIDFLCSYPLAGQATDLPMLRRIVARPYPYLIFYQVLDGEIVVIAVRHAARDPHTMPDEASEK